MITDRLRAPAYMPDLLVRALARGRSLPAVQLPGATLSYAQLRDRISQFAQAYTAAGVMPGTPVAVLSANRPEVFFVLGAGYLTATRATALHPKGSLDDHAFVLEDAGIDTLVFDPAGYADHVVALAERLPGLTRLFSLGPAPIGTDLVTLADTFTPRRLVAPQVHADQPSSLVYTGGSTGRPKGVVGTYRSTAMLTQIQLSEWEWPTTLRFLFCTPLGHAAGGFWIPVLLRGGSMVAMSAFSATAFLETVQRERITATMLVPTMLYAILDHPDLDSYDVSSLEVIYYGASPISPSRLAEAIRRFGPIFFQFYGQTESPMTISVMRRSEHREDDLERLASCGRPVAWLEVALLDPDGTAVSPGVSGEVCVRGPLVTDGYWNRPEETDRLFAGGWLHTGDIARQDADGFLTIVDRTKDVIISGGFNVFPREIEDVISAQPAVAEVAVIGVPDPKWGEAVKAVVVPQPGQHPDVAAIIAAVRERKGPSHAPKSVDIVSELPLTAVGKPDKPTLRQRYWQGQTRQVG
ncbi:fatty-acyl-CoA synthase [Branchiibius hedensis]|uniref:Fatty-acyl-CoA synthase n=1 Tax=Branchiibius hedensis TaxID=672460 RepID=A0A2Y9BUK7_9MICO|nr:AMP-binding protein [Branchiibius hedensis]PWJ27071.1 fatty-acyl-CoA synthase [Branchiibius hedensis]SSA35882.1 fatty-acyl-CoA synthase [Branchiibius hedensis]